MRASCSKVSRPVFRLRRPLYGWSCSGNIWEKHVSDINYEIDKANKLAGNIAKATATGWSPVENWPQTFWKRNKGGHINVLTVYVDDFVMAGKDHRSEWKAIQEHITISEPCVVGRVLGVHFNFKDGASPNLKHVTMDMDNYAQQA